MKNLIVLAVATLFATNAVAAEMKWNGSAGWRYSQTTADDSLDSKFTVAGSAKDISSVKTKAHHYRANLGVMGGWEHVEYGFGVRTNAAANDDYVTTQQNADKAVNFDQAWFRYTRDFGSVDMGVTVGRQKNAMAYDMANETLFDNDVRWDGFGWNFKFGMFGFNAVQYVLGSVTHSINGSAQGSAGAAGASSFSTTEASQAEPKTTKSFAMLYGFQPHMNWKFSDEIEAMFAIAWYKWIYEGDTNATGGGRRGNTAGTIPSLANNTYRMNNNSQWDFLANVSLPMNFAFNFDYVKANKAAYNDVNLAGGWASTANTEVSSSAWSAGLTYGKLRKAQDFTVGYAYGSKGVASVINTYTSETFLADNKGHTINAGYAMADNLHLGFKMMMLQEKERIDSRATATAAQGAGAAYANIGTNQNANQKMKMNYWELTAGVAF